MTDVARDPLPHRTREAARAIASQLISQWATQAPNFPAEAEIIGRARAFQHFRAASAQAAELLPRETTDELVSIIVPTFNSGAYLPQALDSLLAQTHRPLQLIVVDDGSTDETPRLLDSYASQPCVEIITLPQNEGLSRAKNAGLRAAQGEWIGFLSADDLYLPQAVETLLEAARLQPEAGVVYADFDYFGECDYLQDPESRARLRPVHIEDLFTPGVTVGMCGLFRRSLLGDGPAPVEESLELRGVEDNILWQDLWRKAVFLHVPQVLGRYRRHNRQLTREILRTTGYETLLDRSRKRYWRRYGRPRRALLVYPACCVGGAERLLAQLAVALRRHGVHCEACFLEDGGGVSQFRLSCPTTVLDDVRGGLTREEALAEVVSRGRYDLVQHSFVTEIVDALELADYPGLVVEVDHGWPENSQADMLQPDAFVTVSNSQARKLRRHGVRLRPHVIHNGVDLDLYGSPRERHTETGDGRPIVAWVGRLNETKRPALFLEVVHRLARRRPEVAFWMAAAVGPYTAAHEVEMVAAACRAYPQLRLLLGLMPPHMPGFYQCVRARGGVLVMTSVDEPFGLVAIEAMAAGLPVVASRSGGLLEIVEEGTSGLLVGEPYAPQEAAELVLRLFDSPHQYCIMSEAARQRVASKFSLDAMVQRYYDLYSSLGGWDRCTQSARTPDDGATR
jgi:glycosyltransferase involved in cell wall biosynthesis